MQNHHFRGVFKSRIPAFQNAREPDALSGRFAVAPTGLVDSTLNAAHRAAASVDVAPLGEYMCRRHMAHTGKSMALCKHSHALSCIRTCFACARLGETRKRKMDSLSGQYYEPRILLCLIDYIIIIKNRINLFRLYKSIKNNLNAINLS